MPEQDDDPRNIDTDLASYWTAPGPRELPALRTALAEHMRSPVEHQATAAALAAGRGTLVPAGAPHRAASILLGEEHERLKAAQLFYVTEDMATLARTAGESLPDFHLDREDLPTPGGFVLFASPIGSYLVDDGDGLERVFITAVSWGATHAFDAGPEVGIWVTFWSPTHYPRMARRLMATHRMRRDEAERTARQARAEMSWDNETFLQFGPNTPVVAPSGGHRGGDETIAPWIQTLRATWLLMTQPGITDVAAEHLPRQARRRAEREGYQAEPVQVVRLRAHPGAREQHGGDSGEGRGYTVRWMVRGHWRQQPYGPQRSKRRPTWINPHVKGPEGAPLHTGEKVYLVDRPPASGHGGGR